MIAGTDNRFKNLERKVGIFVIIALLGLFGVAVLIVSENDLFSPTYDLRLTAPKGTGFSKGMPIKLSGFRIGRVKSITLNDTAAVDVVLQIGKKYKKWVRKDSVAKLIKEGMIGDYIIEIQSGTSPELIAENGVIILEKTKGLDELAEEIAEKVKPVLMDVRDIIAYVNSDNGDVKNTLRNLNKFTANIDGTREKTEQLLASSRHNLDGTFKRVDELLVLGGKRIDQVGPLLEKTDKSLSDVQQRIPVLLGKVEKSLANVEALTVDIKAASDRSLPKVPRLLDTTEGLLNNSESVLEGVKGVWPISSVVDKPQGRPLLKGDRHE